MGTHATIKVIDKNDKVSYFYSHYDNYECGFADKIRKLQKAYYGNIHSALDNALGDDFEHIDDYNDYDEEFHYTIDEYEDVLYITTYNEYGKFLSCLPIEEFISTYGTTDYSLDII